MGGPLEVPMRPTLEQGGAHRQLGESSTMGVAQLLGAHPGIGWAIVSSILRSMGADILTRWELVGRKVGWEHTAHFDRLGARLGAEWEGTESLNATDLEQVVGRSPRNWMGDSVGPNGSRYLSPMGAPGRPVESI